MFPWELDAVKSYFDSYLAKRFIETYLISYFLLVLIIQKPKKGI